MITDLSNRSWQDETLFRHHIPAPLPPRIDIQPGHRPAIDPIFNPMLTPLQQAQQMPYMGMHPSLRPPGPPGMP